MHPEIQALVEPYLLGSVARDLDAVLRRLLDPSAASTLALDASVPFERGAPAVGPSATPSRYEDLGEIGVGGMGEVRRVRDRELGRTCADKAVRAELSGRATVVARFVDEAQIGAQLQHPNIPRSTTVGSRTDARGSR